LEKAGSLAGSGLQLFYMKKKSTQTTNYGDSNNETIATQTTDI